MEGKRVITSLNLQNFLSFGSDAQEIELQPLNVLIGPNASGKSNFIEAFRILNAAPEDIGKPIREGGGINEYLWKGSLSELWLELQVVVNWQDSDFPLLYALSLSGNHSLMYVVSETIKLVSPTINKQFPEFFYSTGRHGYGELISRIPIDKEPFYRFVKSNIVPVPSHSVLSQYKNPDNLPSFSRLQDVFSSIHFYGSLNLGKYGLLRYPQRADLPSTTLLEDGSNLALVLLNKSASVRQEITERLKVVLPSIEEIFPKLEGGTVPLYFREKGFSNPIPATRLSEGTLRYLCLLALLLDPTPPPIICLEEPEVGLHPHVIPHIAELLIDASQRTQLIVTTHSDALISGLSEHPEAIVICERDDEGTKLRRLEAEQIKPWLDRYAIGDLWRMGEIGGVR